MPSCPLLFSAFSRSKELLHLSVKGVDARYTESQVETAFSSYLIVIELTIHGVVVHHFDLLY